jgi:hypothetical protein
MIKQITLWLADTFSAILGFIFTLVGDTFILFLKLILLSISGLVMLIPAPCCINTSGGLTGLLNLLPVVARYFLGMLNLHQFMILIACGFTFRIARKIVTLGQW